MRLAYRIASLTPVWPAHFGMQVAEVVASEKEAIAKSEVILIDNVADYFAAHQKAVWDCR